MMTNFIMAAAFNQLDRWQPVSGHQLTPPRCTQKWARHAVV